jgi:LysM repeat protein
MVARISGWTICLLVLLAPVAGCNRGGDEAQPTAPASPTAAPAPVVSPSPSPEQQTYTVESGDTLSEIAQRFDTTVEAIMEANDRDDPDVLSIGDELIIPPPGEEPPSEAPASEAPAAEAPASEAPS